MKRRAYLLLVLALLAVTSLTWAAAPPSATSIAGQFLPVCNCSDDWECPGSFCGFDNCTVHNGYFQVCE
jgi:hypothetical protein